MKNWFQIFRICLGVLFLMVFISPSMCVGDECFSHVQSYPEEEKVYILPESIYLSQNQIYVNFEGSLIPIPQLFCDGSGMFSLLKDIQMGKAREGTWTCPKPGCGYANYSAINYCGICGTYRYAKFD